MKSNTGKIAEIFAKLKNPTRFGLIRGVVTKDLPEIEIDIGNGILLTKESLLFSAGILEDYEREYEIKSDAVEFDGGSFKLDGVNLVTDSVGTTATPRPISSIPEGSATGITFSTKKTDGFKSTGVIKLTDQIKKDDEVMLMATESNQLFYVIDKVISFQ